MSVTLPIDEIDFLSTGKEIFLKTFNIQFTPLNWSRPDVEYLHTTVDPNYKDQANVWIKVDAYPTLSDESPIVKNNGRHYDMAIVVPLADLEFTEPEPDPEPEPEPEGDEVTTESQDAEPKE